MRRNCLTNLRGGSQTYGRRDNVKTQKGRGIYCLITEGSFKNKANKKMRTYYAEKFVGNTTLRDLESIFLIMIPTFFTSFFISIDYLPICL